MSEHSCGTSCGCGPKAAATPAKVGGTTALPSSSAKSPKVGIQNGKGSAPRNMSTTFLKNYDGIRWSSGGKKRKDGAKFVKTYA